MKITRQFDLVLKLGIFVLTLLSAAMIYLYFQVDRVLASTRQEMEDMIVDRYRMELRNAARLILDRTRGSELLEAIEHNRTLRRELQDLLFYFNTPEIENLFVIFKDRKGRYRYLLDSERNYEKRAFYKQRFEPISQIWDETYRNEQEALHKHIRNGKLWLTLTVPIRQEGRIVAVVGSDLSAIIRSDVERRFLQIKRIMFTVAAVTVLMLVFGYIQIFYYFKGRKRSFMDPLTGAYNRKFLYEVLANGNYEDYQIIMYDVDHFKRINDTYGHEIGDKVLRLLTKRVAKMLRSEDYLVRFGGEEFIVFLHTRSEERVKEVARRIKIHIDTTPFVIGKIQLKVTVSMGLNAATYTSRNIDEAVEVADEQLYYAKNAGRDKICLRGEVV